MFDFLSPKYSFQIINTPPLIQYLLVVFLPSYPHHPSLILFISFSASGVVEARGLSVLPGVELDVVLPLYSMDGMATSSVTLHRKLVLKHMKRT